MKNSISKIVIILLIIFLITSSSNIQFNNIKNNDTDKSSIKEEINQNNQPLSRRTRAPPNVNVTLSQDKNSIYSGDAPTVFVDVDDGSKDYIITMWVDIDRSIKIENSSLLSSLTPPSLDFGPPIPQILVSLKNGTYIGELLQVYLTKVWIYNSITSKYITFIESANVTFNIWINGSPVYSNSYDVIYRSGSPKVDPPPIVWNFPDDINNGTSSFKESFGLSPQGWSINDTSFYRITVVGFDNNNLEDNSISVNYKVNMDNWQKTTNYDNHPFMDNLTNILNQINMLTTTVRNWFQIVKNILDLIPFKPWDWQGGGLPTLPDSLPCILIRNYTIPKQNAGDYVEYFSKIKDSSNQNSSTPHGLYFVDNSSAEKRVLILDPNQWLWLLKKNLQNFTDNIPKMGRFNVPDKFKLDFNIRDNISKISLDGIFPFKHWEYIASDFDIYIAKPSKNIPNLLNEFKPDVIFLSNLWLGYSSSSNSMVSDWFEWDLKDLGVLDNIIKYVKDNNTGLIATQGTLCDWKLDDTAIGTLGHVGTELEDINIFDEKTLSAMLGLPILPLWEVVKDYVSQAVPSPYNKIIKSIPLQIPFVPFKGNMTATDEAEHIDWNIPENFNVSVPSHQFGKNYTAFTQIGWQLSMPLQMAKLAWKIINETCSDIVTTYQENISKLCKKIKSTVSNISIIDNLTMQLKGGLKEIYNSIVNASICDRNFSLELNLSTFGYNHTRKINIPLIKNAMETLLRLIPIKLPVISEDYKAGIVTYDKYFVKDGFRSVYFSYEAECSESENSGEILRDAINWTINWSYKDLFRQIADKFSILKPMYDNYTKIIKSIPSCKDDSEDLLNEGGWTNLNFTINGSSIVTIIIVHPTSEKINFSLGCNVNVTIISNITMNGITKLILEVNATNIIHINISADADQVLNPSYISISENCLPIVDFNYQKVIGTGTNYYVNETIEFLDNSQDDYGITDWEWNFGDGTISYAQNPKHEFLTSGEKSISLTVTDKYNAKNTIIKDITILLDNDHPITTLNIGEPKFSENPTYVSSATEFNLTTFDIGIGIARIWYKIDDGQWSLYSQDFQISTPGTHIIYYNATDLVGLKEPTNICDIFVDDSSPQTTLEIIGAKFGTLPIYVSASSEFNLTTNDNDGAGIASIWYKIDDGSWLPYSINFSISEFGEHTIYYYSIDHLGNIENTNSLVIVVDNEYPITNLEIGNPKYGIAPTFVKSTTEFSISSNDGDGSGVAEIYYKLDSGSWLTFNQMFTISEPGNLTIYYYTQDNVGQIEKVKSIDVFVDDVVPITDLIINGPKFGNLPTYISTSTKFSFVADDDYGVGIDTTWFNLDDSNWTQYQQKISFITYGEHTIQYYSKDKLGNIEETQVYTVILDDIKPLTEIKIGSPKYGSKPTYIKSDSEISLLATDNDAGLDSILYQINDGSWNKYNNTFMIKEAGSNIINYYSIDNVGNEESSNSYEVFVDDKTPISKLNILSSNKNYYLSTTEFNITSQDVGSGIESIWYKIDNDSWSQFASNFKISIEGNHSIQYYAIDLLGNEETTQSYNIHLILEKDEPDKNDTKPDDKDDEEKDEDKASFMEDNLLMLVLTLIIIVILVILFVIILRRNKDKVTDKKGELEDVEEEEEE